MGVEQKSSVYKAAAVLSALISSEIWCYMTMLMMHIDMVLFIGMGFLLGGVVIVYLLQRKEVGFHCLLLLLFLGGRHLEKSFEKEKF